MAGFQQFDVASVTNHKILCNCQAETGSATARRSAEGFEKLTSELFGDTGPIIFDSDFDKSLASLGLNDDATLDDFAQGVGRVAAQIKQHAKDLLAVCVDNEITPNIVFDNHPIRQ